MGKEINSDYLLWERIKAGETQSFHELYMRYADILFSFGRIFTKDQELVKDCIHDLILDLYKYRKGLSVNDNIRNYLFRSLKRKIYGNRLKKVELVYEENIHRDTTASDEEDELEEQHEKLKKIMRLIDRLPEKQREILHLRFQLDLSYEEIAQVMEISVESVRTSVYRSVKSLREDLQIRNLDLLFMVMRTGVPESFTDEGLFWRNKFQVNPLVPN